MTHKQRKARRQCIARAIAAEGLTLAKAASRFRVSLGIARQAAKEFNVKPPPPAKPPDRRLPGLVERVRGGSSMSRVAANAGIPWSMLSRGCHAAGVYPPQGSRRGPQYKPPARYSGVDWTRADRDLARSVGRTQEAVSQIRHKLLARGMIAPRPRPVRQGASKPWPLTKTLLLKVLSRGLSSRDPEQHLVGLCRRAKPHADYAARLIRQGRAKDRPYVLGHAEVLDLLAGMAGRRRRLAAIFALGPLMPIPLDADLRRQLFGGFTGDVLYNLFCQMIQPEEAPPSVRTAAALPKSTVAPSRRRPGRPARQTAGRRPGPH
jgi:hypothetical protein